MKRIPWVFQKAQKAQVVPELPFSQDVAPDVFGSLSVLRPYLRHFSPRRAVGHGIDALV